MKKIFITLLLLVGITAMAQRPDGKERKGKHNAMRDFTPEQVATLQTKKMTLALDLTTAQQNSVKALALENAKARKAKMEERKAKRKDGEAKKPTAEERFTMQNEMLDHKIAQRTKMKNILSEEQFAKWQKMNKHRGHGKDKDGKKRNGKKHNRTQEG